MRFTTLALTSALLALPQAGLAQEAEGRYATHDGTATVQELPDGSTVQVTQYSQITFSDDASHPLDNTSSECVGRFHVAADGSLISGDGMCSSFGAGGDTNSWWWRVDESGTDKCPDLCGSWGYFNGSGKYAGIEGTGTWVRTTVFPNGSSGTWKGKAKVK
jgi:hypothetical protein